MELAVLIFATFFNILLGSFIFLKDKKNVTFRLFAALNFLIAVWSISSYISLYPPSPESTLFWIRVNMSAATAMNVGFLCLVLNIPNYKLKINLKLLLFLICLTIITIFVAQSPYLFTHLVFGKTGVQPVPGPGIPLFMVTALGSLVAAVVISFKRLFKSTKQEKLQLMYVTAGMTVMSLLIIGTIFIPTVFFNGSDFVVLGPLYTFTFLIPTTYAIVAHKLFDVKIAVRRAMIMFYDTFLFATIGSGIFLIQYVITNQFSGTSYLLSLVLCFVLGATHSEIHGFTKNSVDSKVFRKFVSKNKAIALLAETVNKQIDINIILKQIHDVIKNSLGLKNVSIFLFDDQNIDQDTYQSILDTQKISAHVTRNDLAGLLKILSYPDIIALDEIPRNKLTKTLAKFSIEVLLIFYDGKEIIGVALLGEKVSNDPFTKNDIDLLNSIVPQISAAIVKSKYYAAEKNYANDLKKRVDRATYKLKKQKEQLQEKYQFEKDMMGILGHELRTPMTVAKGMAELMLVKINANNLDKQYLLEKTNKVYDSIIRESDLIQTMLSTSHVDNGKINLQIMSVNLQEILEYVNLAFRTEATKKGLELQYQTPTFAIPMIESDPSRVQEIINNLVSNAVKYTYTGYVRVYLTKDTDFITVHVEDTGIGIPQHEMENLGKKFYRLHQHLDKYKEVVRSGGTGLGLYVVKGVLQAMGGRFEVKSEEGKGSVFSASFPLNFVPSDGIIVNTQPIDQNDMFEKLGYK